MKTYHIIIFTIIGFAQITGAFAQNEKSVIAFPGAEGFGQYTTGGRGGKVIYVTHLKDDGPGSLRKAVETAGPRYILFKVSGTIELEAPLSVKHGDLTIAGQTAPGDGICVKNYPFYIDADNVIIRFMRFRLGDEKQREDDALGSRFHKNIIVDHCSMSWSVDECVSFYSNENTTVQWCIISESLNYSAHRKGPHGYGGIWGGKRASFHHNLLAHHNSRNPRLGERANEAFALTDLVDMRNNVIYNWGANSCYAGEAMNVNIVNCYYKPGPATQYPERIIRIWKNEKPGAEVYNIWGKFYIHGNYIAGSERATNDNWTYGINFRTKGKDLNASDLDTIRLDEALPIYGNVYTHEAEVAYAKVTKYAGASLARDEVDQRVIRNVLDGDFTASGSKGSDHGIIDSQEDVGGYPLLKSKPAPDDSSNDGMPDSWKAENGLDPKLSQTNGRDLHADYDNLEIYLNSLVTEITKKQK